MTSLPTRFSTHLNRLEFTCNFPIYNPNHPEAREVLDTVGQAQMVKIDTEHNKDKQVKEINAYGFDGTQDSQDRT